MTRSTFSPGTETISNHSCYFSAGRRLWRTDSNLAKSVYIERVTAVIKDVCHD